MMDFLYYSYFYREPYLIKFCDCIQVLTHFCRNLSLGKLQPRCGENSLISLFLPFQALPCETWENHQSPDPSPGSPAQLNQPRELSHHSGVKLLLLSPRPHQGSEPQHDQTPRCCSKLAWHKRVFALWSFSLSPFNSPGILPVPGSYCAFLCRNEMINISLGKKGFPQSSTESKAATCWTHSEMEIVGPENHLNLAFLSAAAKKRMETNKKNSKKVESSCLTDSKK